MLVAIAAALAGKGAGSLYDLVKRKFNGRRDAEAALQAAQGATPDSAEVEALSEQLAAADQSDPEFSSALRSLWKYIAVTQHAHHDGVVNQITGNVTRQGRASP